ncbi:MAG: acetoacetate decarboxylase family protein [Myxococcales bacterium]|nr:acetoacetate decarboxylase family protein [Myxococcales bacterium]MCB9630089.1 acetoacetate decarboxylase family protein [Sandaracinaceae bacterium]
MSPVAFPPAPWHTHGRAFVAPYLVRVADLALPSGLEVAHPGPLTLGLLSYVVYEAPSPLLYDELIWMPAFVQDRRCGPRAKGWYVSVMYVNENTTLHAGREIWKLPKTLARFTNVGDELRVDADDGTSLALRMKAFGPTKTLRSSTSTLQAHDGETRCRFTASFRADVSAASMALSRFSSSHPPFMGLARARRAGPAVAQRHFESTMEAPVFLPRV